MRWSEFHRRLRLPVSAAEAFAWHERPGAFERLNPPWQPVTVVEHHGIQDGARVVLRIPAGPVALRWELEHRDYRRGEQFRDVQVRGPFAAWNHTHRFDPAGPDACYLDDHIEYRLPLGAPARLLAGRHCEQMLDRLFDYRHRTTYDDLRLHHMHREKSPMKIAVTGSTGLVGSALISLLTGGGHKVLRLVRTPKGRADELAWDPAAERFDVSGLEGVDAVVHLAGEPIAARRWNDEQKKRILDSREQGTRLLAGALAMLEQRPKTLVCASAIGFYGERGDELLDESSRSGDGFLAEVCRRWEAASAPAARAGIRVVNLRLGVVLSPAGGALKKMLTPFKLGLGGRLGSGRQYMSWITLDDAIGAAYHALMSDNLAGPVNAVAPAAVTNQEFTKTLGRVLRRPTVFPVPEAVVRLAFGQMGNELLLASTRVKPARLLESGYAFRQPQLEDGLRHVLGRPKKAKKK